MTIYKITNRHNILDLLYPKPTTTITTRTSTTSRHQQFVQRLESGSPTQVGSYCQKTRSLPGIRSSCVGDVDPDVRDDSTLASLYLVHHRLEVKMRGYGLMEGCGVIVGVLCLGMCLVVIVGC